MMMLIMVTLMAPTGVDYDDCNAPTLVLMMVLLKQYGDYGDAEQDDADVGDDDGVCVYADYVDDGVGYDD